MPVPDPGGLRFIAFDARHLGVLRPHRGQPEARRPAGGLAPTRIIPDQPGWSCTLLDGVHPRACFGVMPWADGHGVAWAMIGDGFGPVREWALPRLNELLDRVHRRGLLRIHATVRMNFRFAHRFASRLGFERKTVTRAAGAGGAEYGLYVRLRAL